MAWTLHDLGQRLIRVEELLERLLCHHEGHPPAGHPGEGHTGGHTGCASVSGAGHQPHPVYDEQAFYRERFMR